ncbi:hypothetical protein BDZ45DRAFT_728427 [Acephala macrosclerotiorum]|nr:hypothetical protein BDZ45DRAFT_728427 [Acephala macrosclerotiorum]
MITSQERYLLLFAWATQRSRPWDVVVEFPRESYLLLTMSSLMIDCLRTSEGGVNSVNSNILFDFCGTSCREDSDQNSESGPLINKSKVPAELQTHFQDPHIFVKFIVGSGENEKTFTVHPEVALKVPIFFSAFTNPFFEQERGGYRLEDLKPCWSAWSKDNKLDDSLARDEDLNLIELWILGDRLCYLSLQEWVLVTTASLINMKGDFAFDILQQAYNNTIDNSELHWLAVEQAAKKITLEEIKPARGKLPNDLLLDLIILQLAKCDEVDKSLMPEGSSIVSSTFSTPPSLASLILHHTASMRSRMPALVASRRSTGTAPSTLNHRSDLGNNRPASGVMNTVGTALRRMKST